MNNDPSSPPVSAPKRRRFSPIQIQQLLDEFQRSGLSSAAFAREHDLCYATFCRWRKQQRSPRSALRRAQPELQAVALDSLLSPRWAAEIVLPACATLRLSAQASPSMISHLVEALRR